MALDTANLPHPDGGGDAGDVIARCGDDDGDARPRIRRTANDLFRAVGGLDPADAQPVSVRVGGGFGDMAEPERLQRLKRVVDAFDLQPEVGQRGGDLFCGGGGFKVAFQPRRG